MGSILEYYAILIGRVFCSCYVVWLFCDPQLGIKSSCSKVNVQPSVSKVQEEQDDSISKTEKTGMPYYMYRRAIFPVLQWIIFYSMDAIW